MTQDSGQTRLDRIRRGRYSPGWVESAALGALLVFMGLLGYSGPAPRPEPLTAIEVPPSRQAPGTVEPRAWPDTDASVRQALNRSAPHEDRLAGIEKFVGERMAFEFGWRAPTGVCRVAAAHGRMRVDMTELGGRRFIRLTGQARTVGLVKTLWNMKDSVVALVDADTLLAWRQVLEQNEGDTRTKQVITFNDDGRTAERYKIRYHKPPGKRETRETFMRRSRLCAATLAFYLRLRPAGARTLGAVFFEGKENFRVNVEVKGREKIRVPAGTFHAYRLRVTFKCVDPGRKKKKRDEKIKKATVWVSVGPERLPLRLESETFVGSVYGELTGYELSPAMKKIVDKRGL